MAELKLRTLSQIDEVDAASWNALLDPEASPFVDWRWLSALERSGCAAPRRGWQPRHLTLWQGPKLVAAAPAYSKDHSDGDFARDYDLGAAASRAGLPYYPKLTIGVPFTPASGRRFLCHPAHDRPALQKALLDAAKSLAHDEGLGTIQVLFPRREEAGELEGLGLAKRVSFQFHWHNAEPGYRDFDDFLTGYNAKRRAMMRREKRAAEKQGIGIETLRGDVLAADPDRWAKVAHELHSSTVDKLMWGMRWLNQGFYTRVFAAMPEHLELVVARRAGKIVAGAFNVSSKTHLFGRYWGCFEEHPFLHFNVCYYHSIEDCIARGLTTFEGGAGGEHKASRGFDPTETYSAHLFLDARVDRSLREHLRRETPERERALDRWRAEQQGNRARVLA
jgi:predicted N-acyltransferase